MTRINIIPVELLTDQHLMAEYRELPMVLASLARTLQSKRGWDNSRVPPTYTLNKGHVTFFYNKGVHLQQRFNALVSELNTRQYKVDPDQRVIDWTVFQRHVGLNNNWLPTLEEQKVNVARIVQRIQQKPTWYRFYGRSIDSDFIDRQYSKYIDLQED